MSTSVGKAAAEGHGGTRAARGMGTTVTTPLTSEPQTRSGNEIAVADAGDGDHRVRGQLLGLGADQPARARSSGPPAALGTLSESDVALLVAVPVVVGLARPHHRRRADRPVRRPGDVPDRLGRDDPPDPVHRLLRPRLLRPAPGRRLLPRHRRHGVRRRRPLRQRLVPAREARSRDRHLRRRHGRHRDQRPDHREAHRPPRRQGALPDHRRGAGLLRASPPGWSCATHRAGWCPPPRWLARISANARLPITWQACLLYAVAFGGYVAFSVYLPAYLKTAHGLTPADAANRMAGFVLVAVVMRPVGGWLADKLGAIPVLATGFGVVVVVRRRSRPAPRRWTASARSRSSPWPPPSAPAAGPPSPSSPRSPTPPGSVA